MSMTDITLRIFLRRIQSASKRRKTRFRKHHDVSSSRRPVSFVLVYFDTFHVALGNCFAQPLQIKFHCLIAVLGRNFTVCRKADKRAVLFGTVTLLRVDLIAWFSVMPAWIAVRFSSGWLIEKLPNSAEIA